MSQSASDAVVLLRLESGRYYSLESVGRTIWELSDGGHTVAQIVRAVSAEYRMDPAIVRADALELLSDLAAEGLVDDAG